MSGLPDFGQMSFLDAALRYAALGWPVFPLAPRTKEPLPGSRGCSEATVNERVIREWWGKHPNANIGLATGHAWFVLDNDPKDGGAESLAFLIDHHGPLPETIVQVTGSGGEHYLFRAPADFQPRNSQGKNGGLANGIDIRGRGGYIVAPPSIHPTTGIAYQWYGETALEERVLAEAPAWLLDWLRKHAARLDAKPDVAARPSDGTTFAKGTRHHALLKFAGSLRRRNLPAELIFQMLCTMNQQCCDPPYPNAHLRQMADWMGKRPADARFDLFKGAPRDPDARDSDNRDEAPLSAVDVEAGADDCIAREDLLSAIKLAPEIAKLRPVMQAVLIAKLATGFKGKGWPKDFERTVREEAKRLRAEAGGDEDAGSSAPPPVPDGASALPSGSAIDLRWYPLTDGGNAERILALHGADVRYCWEIKKWLVWDGKRWCPDDKKLIRHKVVLVARELYKQAVGNPPLEKHARAFECWSSIRDALAILEGHPKVAISATELDQHPYLFNCTNGVLDLKGPRLLEHNRDFLITKLCPVDYDPLAPAPTFQAFVEWAMGSKIANPDADLDEHVVRLVGFLQRAVGQSLTADTSEKAVFIFYGEQGNNGKTTFLTLFRDLLGKDYSCQIGIETIMQTRQQDATMRADLADLRGCRFAVTSEVEKEHKLNTRIMKYLTGGQSEIKSCRKYENPIEFRASHHLFMDCNHRPRITDADDAIWNRLKLVPFEVSIAKEQIDLQLPNKLRAEMKGILAWAVRGCMTWQREGLGSPPEVAAASLAWREHDDPIKQFMEDCCDFGETHFCRVTQLSEVYVWWCKANNEKFLLGRENFNERLKARLRQEVPAMNERQGVKEWQARSRRFDNSGEPSASGTQARTWEGVALKDDVLGAMSDSAMVSRPRSRQSDYLAEKEF